MARVIVVFSHLVIGYSPKMDTPMIMAAKPYKGKNKPNIKWKSIIKNNTSYHPNDFRKHILETATQELKTYLKFIKNSDSFDNVSQNYLLLYGKTGTGKTVAAQALAQESGKYYTFINAINLMDPYENTVKQALSKAVEQCSGRPHVIVLDNIECFTKEHVDSFKNFLNECKSKNKFVVAITEKLENLPKEIRDCFMKYSVSISAVKTNASRKQIVLSHLSAPHNCDDHSLDLLMTRLNTYSNRSLKQVAECAYENAWFRNKDNIVITEQDFYSAIKRIEDDSKILAGDNWKNIL